MQVKPASPTAANLPLSQLPDCFDFLSEAIFFFQDILWLVGVFHRELLGSARGQRMAASCRRASAAINSVFVPGGKFFLTGTPRETTMLKAGYTLRFPAPRAYG